MQILYFKFYFCSVPANLVYAQTIEPIKAFTEIIAAADSDDETVADTYCQS